MTQFSTPFFIGYCWQQNPSQREISTDILHLQGSQKLTLETLVAFTEPQSQNLEFEKTWSQNLEFSNLGLKTQNATNSPKHAGLKTQKVIFPAKCFSNSLKKNSSVRAQIHQHSVSHQYSVSIKSRQNCTQHFRLLSPIKAYFGIYHQKFIYQNKILDDRNASRMKCHRHSIVFPP